MDVNSSYARPLQGMSGQADEVRQEGQCTLQINYQPSVLEGLSKRIGSELIRPLVDQLTHADVVHYYARDNAEQYWIVVRPNGEVVVYNKDGIKQVVTIDASSKAYLVAIGQLPSSGNATGGLGVSAQTIGDFTFLSNPGVVPKWADDVEPNVTNTALVPVLFADYGKTYSIIINGAVAASYKTPDGSLPEHIDKVDTSYVADRLVASIQGGLSPSVSVTEPGSYTYVLSPGFWGGRERPYRMYYRVKLSRSRDLLQKVLYDGKTYNPLRYEGDYCIFYESGDTYGPRPPSYDEPLPLPVQVQYAEVGSSSWVVQRNGNTITIRNRDGTPFTLTTTDGRDGGDMPGIMHQVDDLSKLPKLAPVGYQVQVTGKGKSEESRYWLVATRTNSGSDTIVWEEARTPGLKYKLDPKTMPQALIRKSLVNGVATFEVGPADWAKRMVGSDKSNPPPSFITDGSPISTIGVFQNRLFFLAGEGFLASRSNDFFNLFKMTTQTDSDDNPIDVYADTDEVNVLRSYTSLDGDLVLMSDNAQFVMKGDKPVTKSNAHLKLVTQYKNEAHVRPISTGETVLFAYSEGQYTQVREFFTDSFSDTKKARPVTEHVSTLMPGKIRKIIGSTNVNTALFLPSLERNRMYVYEYLWQGQDKVQSAWWIYELGGVGSEILHAVYDKGRLLMLVNRFGYGTCLEVSELGDPDSDGLSFPVRLDRRRRCVMQKTGLNEWTLMNDLPVLEGDTCVLAAGGWVAERGNTVQLTKVGGVYKAMDQDLGPEDVVEVWVGESYRSLYIPTMPVLKDQRGLPLSLDRLTVGTMYINFIDTGHFIARVKTLNRSREYIYDGRRMGSPDNIIGFSPLDTGQFAVPIRNRSSQAKLEIETSSYLPFTMRNLDWRGQYNPRGRRV